MRQCGDCQLCCRLLPVHSHLLNKDANERCRHQKFGVGCKVHNTARMPFECGIWNCRWLVNDDTADIQRPDRSHFVIDIMPDFVKARDNITGEITNVEVVQIWVDPKHRDAWKVQPLRDFIVRRSKEFKAVLIRYSAVEAITILANPDTGEVREVAGTSIGEKTHSAREIVLALTQPKEEVK